MPDRTRVLACLSSIAVVLVFSQASAQQAGDGASAPVEAEWAQRYDAGDRRSVGRETVPVLSAQTLAATEAAIGDYESIVARGGWGTVPGGDALHLGSKGQTVVALRHRLQTTGDLDPASGEAPIFDAYVEAGVRRFQARHGMGQTGFVSNETFTALNISADLRLKQLKVNLVRLQSFAGHLGRRFVMANIPAADVETVEDGVVHSHHVAGVGKADRQSPVLQAKAVAVNFNPYWHVPASIIRKDLIPKMQSDPNYLTDNHIHMYDLNDNEVSPSSIDWTTLAATHFKFREDPGVDNSMGVVRINIENPYGVFMHDTATKGIFGDDYRFISSGCIRVQNVRDYVAWLLEDTPGWDRERIDAAIRSGDRIDAKLAAPVPVYWVYVTAWATPDGLVQFRDDIYDRDGLDLPHALTASTPASASIPTED